MGHRASTETSPSRRISRGFAVFAGINAFAAGILLIASAVGGFRAFALGEGLDNAGAHVHVYETGQGWAYQLFHWGSGVSGLAALAVVVAVALLLGGRDNAWVVWASVIAVVGFALTALNHVRAAVSERELVDAYLAADSATQESIAPLFLLLDLDPVRLEYVTVVVWLVAISIIAWRTGTWSRILAGLGLVAAAVVVIVGETAGLAVWFVWIGVVLITDRVRHDAEA